MIDSTRASLELLIRTSRELATSLDLHTTLLRVLHLSTSAVNAERGSLIVLDKDLNPVDTAIVIENELYSDTNKQMQPILQQGLAGWVVNNRQAALIPDTSKDSRWLKREDDQKEKTGVKSAICVPLMAGERVSGVLTVIHKKAGYFTQDHLNVLQSIADQAGIAINNAWLFNSLQAAHSRYQELFQDNIDPIIITNITGNVMEANRQAILLSGFDKESIKGKSVFELHRTSQEKAFESSDYEANLNRLRKNETLNFEARWIKSNNESFPVQIYVRQITLDNDTYLQWIFRDISERKQLDGLREDMISMIYHDLRAPLANIISSLDMLRALQLDKSSPSVSSLVTIASRSTDRMQRLIDSLLDINRLEAGQSILNCKQTSFSEVLLEAIQATQPEIENREQILIVNLEPGLMEFNFDPDMIKRVMINLMDNASKFTPAQGKITVYVKQEEKNIRFAVQDTGPGIPKESLQTVFEKFIRLKNERSPRGLGIGLAFCRLAIEAHGGKIWVESVLGQGSTFQFTLPTEKIEGIS